jgi:hypothetical protein
VICWPGVRSMDLGSDAFCIGAGFSASFWRMGHSFEVHYWACSVLAV